MNSLEKRLLNDFQREFPLTARPFADIGARLGATEAQVINALEALQARGAVSRVGAVFRPGRLGASTLAAMAVPPERLERVASLINSYPQVNHNYEREHVYNLWFVLAAEHERALAALLDEIERRGRLPVLRLPMLTDYHIDLGFPLQWEDGEKEKDEDEEERENEVARKDPKHETLWTQETECFADLIAAMQDGLPLVARPYAAIAARTGMAEAKVCAQLRALQEMGIIKRLGVIVRHHELGYRANAMVVWDVAEEHADALGKRIARQSFVTLCYRRARDLPAWPYNLYCMIHGRDRAAVLGKIAHLKERCGLQDLPSAVLFSQRRFKQRGARYFEKTPAAMQAAVGGDD